MLNKIIGFSVKNKLIIGLFTLALLLFGIYELRQLPIDAQPDITNNQVQVITPAASLSATDIERLVTFPIEQANSNIAGMIEIRSFSRFGLSLVTIVFDDDTDIYWARQQVNERLQSVKDQIPSNIEPPTLGPISTGLGEIYQYILRPAKGYEEVYDATELRSIQDWAVRRQLLGTKGVADVSSFGGKLKQYEVAIDMPKLQALNLSSQDVFTALEGNNQNTGGAYIEKGPRILSIRSEGLIEDLATLKNIAISHTQSGAPIFLHQVAEVKIGHATRYGAMTYNNQGEVAGGIVLMLKGANSSEVIEAVKTKMSAIEKNLPKGVILEAFLDRSKMVGHTISTIESNLTEGALIVVFILVLFLGNLRAGLLVASVIPLAMLFAVIMMNLFGISGNLMSLGALDFGLIVDGSIIIVEAVLYQLHHSKRVSAHISQQEMDHQVGASASKMVNSAVFGQLIILIVYLPIFSLQGIEGKMFKPMAQTVAFALLGAFLLSITYVPMMSSLVLKKKTGHEANFSDKLMAKLENWQQKTLVKSLRVSRWIVAMAMALFVFSAWLLSGLGGEFIPALEEGDFAVETKVLTGSNLQTTVDYTQKAAGILKKEFPEVEKVVGKIGSGEIPTDPMPIEACDMMVILKDKKHWTSAQTFDELAQKMNESLRALPGITTSFQFPVQMRFNELMTGAKQDVVCKIFGEDLNQLTNYANQLGKIIKKIDGAQDLYIEPITGMPQIVIKYHRNSLAQYGLDVKHINQTVNIAFAGQSVGKIYEGEKRFDLVIRLDEQQRQNLDDIKNLLIATPHGDQIPLYQLADVSIQNCPAQIQREDAKRRIVVGFNVRGRDVQSIVNEMQQKVDKKINFAPGYYIYYGGAFENLNKAKDRLMVAVPISLLLIFFLLFFAFNSLKQSLMIYSAIPLSAIGGILFLALRGMPFSISAGIGFIALFGVAVLNGIVLIAEFNRLKTDRNYSLIRCVLQGTRSRLRPVLTTALVASLGFLPMAISHGAGAEVQRPLATVVIGGLMVATFLTLFLLPILYIWFEEIKIPQLKPKSNMKIIAFLLMSSAAFGQNISLNEALKMANEHNLKIKSKGLNENYQQKRIATAYNLPQTHITGLFGQINSGTSDQNIGISQSMLFPTVYARQKEVLKSEHQASIIEKQLSMREIKQHTSFCFYQLLVLQEKERLLAQTEITYANFAKQAKLRVDKGLTNVLEQNSAELQHENILMQIKQNATQIEQVKQEFLWLINSPKAYQPTANSLLMDDSHIALQSQENHPSLQLSEQEISTAKASAALEKSKLWPNLSLAYFNQSFNDINKSRYNMLEIGVGIPIFSQGQRASIKAEEQKIAFNEQQLEVKKAELNKHYQQAYKAYILQKDLLNRYQNQQLQRADMIGKTAQKQFSSGEINYLDWAQLHQQALQIQLNYTQVMQDFNQAVIELQFLGE